MLDLNFSSRVPGKNASEELRASRITQTVRSFKEASKFFSSRGSVVRVTLDGEEIGRARITDISKKIKLTELEQFDAEIGGFSSVKELQNALKRAGFRFKALYEYYGIKIQFLFVDEDGKLTPEIEVLRRTSQVKQEFGT